MPPTIKDIAEKSQISIATVSKYLNGRPVRPSTSAKIEEAIRALNYHVNQTARSLRTSRSMTIGILVDDIRNNFFAHMVSLLSDALQRKDYSSIICEISEEEESLRRQMGFLFSKNVDGIVIISTVIPQQALKEFSEQFRNIVVIDSSLRGVNCDFVLTDNIAATYNATEQFIVKGHRKIAIVTGTSVNFSARERLSGYKRALTDYQIPVNQNWIIQDSYDYEGGYRALKKLLEMRAEGDMPTAVLVTSYRMTTGFIIGVNEENVRIPDDISLIGFDNYDINKVFVPHLTCVAQPVEQLSAAAVSLLFDRMEGKNEDSQIVRIPAQFLPGDSVKRLDR